jgi:aryl-alcohol dehydrogenase-like predicted oxidoreductase
MKYAVLGSTDLEVSQIGLGCSHLGRISALQSTRAAINLLHLAFDNGITLYDTADSYTQGRSETILGRAFKNRREKMVLASKAGYACSPTAAIVAKLRRVAKAVFELLQCESKVIGGAAKRQNFSPGYLTTAIEASLRRLSTDYLDVFQLHSPPREVIEQGDFLEPLERMKTKGAIRFYGISCLTIQDALLCLRFPEISMVQVKISILDCECAQELQSSLKGKRIGVLARQPFGSGDLWRNAARYDFLAKSGGRTLAQAALQFVLQQDYVSATLVGTTDSKHLVSNLAALENPPLSEDEISRVKTLTQSR